MGYQWARLLTQILTQTCHTLQIRILNILNCNVPSVAKIVETDIDTHQWDTSRRQECYTFWSVISLHWHRLLTQILTQACHILLKDQEETRMLHMPDCNKPPIQGPRILKFTQTCYALWKDQQDKSVLQILWATSAQNVDSDFVAITLVRTVLLALSWV